ncbi:MAG: hypothetical protein AB8B72_08390 [Crocinitomicaceae bacterium]
MDFPIYRKYTGIDVWFKIKNQTEFEEIKKIGLRTIITNIEAKIFPEKQFIRDMIDCYENRWEPISESDYRMANPDNLKPVK